MSWLAPGVGRVRGGGDRERSSGSALDFGRGGVKLLLRGAAEMAAAFGVMRSSKVFETSGTLSSGDYQCPRTSVTSFTVA